jgi:hypothetical protein
MPTNLTDALISAKQIPAILRTGIVTDWSPTFVQVNVAGAEIQAAYLDWYQPPIVGDLVALIRQDSTWLVLGRYAGAGANLVLNPSFEDSIPTATAAPGTVPVNWGTFVTITGAVATPASINVVSDADAPQAGQAVDMDPHSPGGTLDVVLTSSAISVTPGEMFFLSAYVANNNFIAPTGSFTTPPTAVQLMACWFTTDVETFPSGTQTDKYTMVQRIPNLREKPPYTYIRGGVKVPSTATIMRIGLRAEFPANAVSTIRWDYVTARRAVETA